MASVRQTIESVTTSLTAIGPLAGAGIAAGLALLVSQLTLDEELETVESEALGIAVAGLALTAYGVGRGEAAQQVVTAYWTIAAIAGVPCVIIHWGRRHTAAAQERARRGVAIAGRDYRVEGAAPPGAVR